MLSSVRFPTTMAWTVGLLLLLPAEPTCAQFPPGPMPGMGPMGPGPIDASGTVDAMGRGLVQIKSVAGEPYMLRLAEGATVHVTGTAKVDVVGHPRFTPFVSFVAEVDKQRSEVQDKVGKLTFFTPSPQRPLGAFPGGSGLGVAAEGEPFGPNPFAPDAGVGQAPPGARQPRSRARRPPAAAKDDGPPVETFEIVGRITGIDKTGKLTVYAPNPYFRPPVRIELTEDPEIELDLTGPEWLDLVKLGDKVQARGILVAPNMVQVNELTIELAEPFTTVEPKEPAKRPSRRTTRSSRTRHVQPEEAAAPEEGVQAEKAVEAEEEEKEQEPRRPG